MQATSLKYKGLCISPLIYRQFAAFAGVPIVSELVGKLVGCSGHLQGAWSANVGLLQFLISHKLQKALHNEGIMKMERFLFWDMLLLFMPSPLLKI